MKNWFTAIKNAFRFIKTHKLKGITVDVKVDIQER